MQSGLRPVSAMDKAFWEREFLGLLEEDTLFDVFLGTHNMGKCCMGPVLYDIIPKMHLLESDQS